MPPVRDATVCQRRSASSRNRGWDRGLHQREEPAQHPRALARLESRCQQPVVDLARHEETVECRRREVQPRVRQTVGNAVNVRFREGHGTVAVLVDPGDFDGIGAQQALADIR